MRHPMSPSGSPGTAVNATDYLVGRLTALAILLHGVELALPTLLPGIKPGLPNAVVLAALLEYGWSVAVWVSLLRVVLASLLFGTFLSPTFVLSLAGATSSLAVLGIAVRLGAAGSCQQGAPTRGLRPGPLGLGVLSAMAHVSGQFLVAWLWLLPVPQLWRLLPVLLAAASLAGIGTGALAGWLLVRDRQRPGSVHGELSLDFVRPGGP